MLRAMNNLRTSYRIATTSKEVRTNIHISPVNDVTVVLLLR